MSFMNKKEDVIEFNLTTYGRHLLSIGKLSPQYYAFFDDDILYDAGFSGDNTEKQGEIRDRILFETPYLSPQKNYSDLNKKILSQEKSSLSKEVAYPTMKDNIDYFNYPLGTTQPLSLSKFPYWNVYYLHATASSVSKTLQSATNNASLPYKNIPQIDFKVDYEITVESIHHDSYMGDMGSSPNLQLSYTADDGTYISIKEDQILLLFKEKHGFNHNDSYEVEVFITDDNGVDLKPLKFISDETVPYKIENGIMENISTQQDVDLFDTESGEIEDPSYVEYYFDLNIDQLIPEDDVCSGVLNLKKEDIFVDMEYDCLERDWATPLNIYSSSRVTDVEDCD